MELFESVQFIAAKIEAAEGTSLLELDQEYIALVKRHLPHDTKLKWTESKKSGWTNFYNFLEEQASFAKNFLLMKPS